MRNELHSRASGLALAFAFALLSSVAQGKDLAQSGQEPRFPYSDRAQSRDNVRFQWDRPDLSWTLQPTDRPGVFIGPGGLYFGANVTLNSSSQKTSEWTVGGILSNEFRDSNSGVGAGLKLGYDFRFGYWRGGPFASIDSYRYTTAHSFGSGASYSVGATTNWIGTVGGRLGIDLPAQTFILPGNTFLYLEGGISNRNQTLNVFGATKTSNVTGWTIGSGLEFGIHSNLSAGVEVLYTRYDTAHFDMPITQPTFNYGWQSDDVTAKLSLNYYPLLPGGLGVVDQPPPRILPHGWTGFYLGGQVVSNRGLLRIREFNAFTDALTNSFDDYDDPLGLGVLAGYTFAPWGNNILVSPYASFDWLDQTINHVFPGGAYLGTHTKFVGTAGVKAGWVTAAGFWLYGIGGVSAMNQDLTVAVSLAPTSTTNVTVPGATLGAGAAVRPDFLQRFGAPVSLFVEWSHTWWQDAHFDRPANSPGFNYEFRRSDDTIKGGITVSFVAAPAAVRTKY